MTSKLSRRDFLRVMKYVGATIFSGTATRYYSFVLEPLWLDVTEVSVPLAHLPRAFDGYRIVQISDIHIGGWMDRERLAEVLALVRQQTPDLIVITGDFFIGRSWSEVLDMAAEDFVAEMSPLTAEYKVLGVMGNHDHQTDAAKTRKALSRSGIIELKNDVHMIVKDGESLCIAGLDDIFEGKHRMDELREKLPVDANSILLAHEPDYADTASRVGRFWLQLSGHSHGGQVVIPFVGPPVLPYWARKYPAGMYQVGAMQLYTNRGVGMTSPYVRFNCRPEITVFSLKSAE